MLLHCSRYVTGTSKRINILPPLKKREGLVWCQMAMCTDIEIMSWQPVGVKRSQITSFTLLSVGIEDSVYYFGNSQYHSCCRSHVRGAERRQQKITESWEPTDPLCKIPPIQYLVHPAAILQGRKLPFWSHCCHQHLLHDAGLPLHLSSFLLPLVLFVWLTSFWDWHIM